MNDQLYCNLTISKDSFMKIFLMCLLMTASVFAKVSRPSGAIAFNNACICKDGKSLSSDCKIFCSDKNTNGDEVLFANFILDHSRLGTFKNVHEWCNNTMGSETTNPKCGLQVIYSDGSIAVLDVITNPRSNINAIEASVLKLKNDDRYRINLIEIYSKAVSDSQIIKPSPL